MWQEVARQEVAIAGFCHLKFDWQLAKGGNLTKNN